jgi:Ni/Co efflux regulator RcnB
MNARIILVIALTVMVGSMALAQQASAELSTNKVWMTITNTKTDTVKTVEWTYERYLFERNIPIDVDDLKEQKIKRIFGTMKFTFTWQLKQYEATWHHFKVVIATKTDPSKTLRVEFV